jgi:hypothetical protein
LYYQAFCLVRDPVGRGRGVFGFIADEVASPLHLANHRAEVGLKKINCFAGAADLDRLFRFDLVLQSRRLATTHLVNACRAL